jgi:hypothetical protein
MKRLLMIAAIAGIFHALPAHAQAEEGCILVNSTVRNDFFDQEHWTIRSCASQPEMYVFVVSHGGLSVEWLQPGESKEVALWNGFEKTSFRSWTCYSDKASGRVPIDTKINNFPRFYTTKSKDVACQAH